MISKIQFFQNTSEKSAKPPRIIKFNERILKGSESIKILKKNLKSKTVREESKEKTNNATEKNKRIDNEKEAEKNIFVLDFNTSKKLIIN